MAPTLTELPRADTRRRPDAAVSTGRAFGLELTAFYPLSTLAASTDGAPLGHVRLEEADPRELDRAWPSAEATSLYLRRWTDGQPIMGVDHHPEAGYRIWAPRNGRHLVSADGTRIRSALPRVAEWRSRRLLFAQVLPLAAVLQGAQLLHASCVALEGRAVAFTASSGTGKTSVAAHLVAAGASFLTDDALALEADGEGLRAYPGPGAMSISPEEWRALPAGRRPRLGSVVGRTDKLHVVATPADRPVPFALLYVLERGGPSLELTRIAADPDLVLATRFLRYLRTPEHVLGALDVCARIEATAQVFRVSVPPSSDAAATARAVRAHALEALRA